MTFYAQGQHAALTKLGFSVSGGVGQLNYPAGTPQTSINKAQRVESAGRTAPPAPAPAAPTKPAAPTAPAGGNPLKGLVGHSRNRASLNAANWK